MAWLLWTRLLVSRLLVALLLAGTTAIASAQEAPHRQGAAQSEQRSEQRRSDESVLRLLPADSVTEHTVDTVGGKLAYTATAGTLWVTELG